MSPSAGDRPHPDHQAASTPAPDQPTRPATPQEPGFGARAADASRKALTALGVGIAVLLAIFAGWFLFGEWWIGVVRRQVSGSAFAGFAFGVSVGLLSSLLSLFFLGMLVRRRVPGWLRIVLGALASIPLAPLVFSLRIALKKSWDQKGSLEYQMLTDGRGYQSGVMVGALAGLIIMLAIWWALYSRRRARRLRREADERQIAADARREAEEEAARQERERVARLEREQAAQREQDAVEPAPTPERRGELP